LGQIACVPLGTYVRKTTMHPAFQECIRFVPRLRDALSRHLYLVDELGAYGPLNNLLFGQIKSKLIIEQWDEIRRVASSIRHGTVSASLLMHKLAAYPRQNQVARALPEMGKLERSDCRPDCTTGMGTYSLDRRLPFRTAIWAFPGQSAPFTLARGRRECLRKEAGNSP